MLLAQSHGKWDTMLFGTLSSKPCLLSTVWEEGFLRT